MTTAEGKRRQDQNCRQDRRPLTSAPSVCSGDGWSHRQTLASPSPACSVRCCGLRSPPPLVWAGCFLQAFRFSSTTQRSSSRTYWRLLQEGTFLSYLLYHHGCCLTLSLPLGLVLASPSFWKLTGMSFPGVPWHSTPNTDGGCPEKPGAFLQQHSVELRQAAGSPQGAQRRQGCLTGHGLMSKGSLQGGQAKLGAFVCPVHVKCSSLNS